ncbi:MAG: hypothetical protein WCI11_17875 [Candidatus Methylumidiphilus sp.]
MASITFDTLKFVRELQESGFEEKQAEGIAEAFKDASGEAELATKRDIERMEGQVREMKAELNGKLTLVQWMLALVVAAEVMPLAAKFFQ